MNSSSVSKRLSVHRLTVICAVLIFSAQAIIAGGLLKVYYVRHGEGGHNVVKEWKARPKTEWPSYVGNPNIFTPKGDSQVVALTQKLHGMKFDVIAASPLWRTRNTILPFLKANDLRAEIWPELAETKYTYNGTTIVKDLPPPGDSLLHGGAIEIPNEEAPFFTFTGDAKFSPTLRDGELTGTADAIELGRRVIKVVKERFAGSDKSILLVGHGNAGSTLLRLLTGVMDFKGLKNTMIWMAEEQRDGSFTLQMFNNEPYTIETETAK